MPDALLNVPEVSAVLVLSRIVNVVPGVSVKPLTVLTLRLPASVTRAAQIVGPADPGIGAEGERVIIREGVDRAPALREGAENAPVLPT